VRRRRAAAAVVLLAALIVVGATARISTRHGQAQRATGQRTPVSSRATSTTNSHLTGGASRSPVPLRTLDRNLTAALARLFKTHTGDLAVGVVDRTTRVRAVYGGELRFHTASIMKADILAALLLRHQAAGTPLTEEEGELARRMIEGSDNDAAQDLWWADGGADGVAEANASLGLRHTTPDEAGYWGVSSTTVADQLTLLSDLVSSRSPLNAASRSYALSLMRHVEPGQSWGVTAAATPGTASAVKNGWLPDPQLWVINSIGVIHHDGRLLLVAVLSDRQPTEAGGIAQLEAAARAAVNAITAVRS
jgi:beta-lactamase class A